MLHLHLATILASRGLSFSPADQLSTRKDGNYLELKGNKIISKAILACKRQGVTSSGPASLTSHGHTEYKRYGLLPSSWYKYAL